MVIREVLLLWLLLWLLLLVVLVTLWKCDVDVSLLVTLWKFDVDVSCGVLLGWSKEIELAAVEEQRRLMESIQALRPLWNRAKHQIFGYDSWILTPKMPGRAELVHQ